MKKVNSNHFEEIGRKGGESTRATYGREHFRKLGKKGGQRIREMVERAKREESARRK